MTQQEESNNNNKNTPNKKNETMDAATALKALGDEESKTASGDRPSSPAAAAAAADKNAEKPANAAEQPKQETKNSEDNDARRYLPDHKKPDAAPTFPEKLMNLMRYAEEQDPAEFCIAWCEDGKSFVIRNPDDFTRNVVPKFFKATKFASFTRKLYRWGFRQINRGIGPDDPIIFGNEFFQKQDRALIAKMRSVTAAGTRKAEEHRHMAVMAGAKRPFEDMSSYPVYGGAYGAGGDDADNHKRMLFNQLMQQQKHMAGMMGGANNNQPYYSGMNGSVPLTSALRPNLGLPGGPGMMGGPNNNMMMMQQMNQQQQGANNNSNNSNNMPQQGNNMNNNNQMHPMQMMNMSQFNNGGMMNQGAGMSDMSQRSMTHFGMNGPNGPQYPDARSTADIVNAAIAALRHAS